MFHFVKHFGIINKTEVQVMLYFISSLAYCPNNEYRVSRASVFHEPTLLLADFWFCVASNCHHYYSKNDFCDVAH